MTIRNTGSFSAAPPTYAMATGQVRGYVAAPFCVLLFADPTRIRTYTVTCLALMR
jgi:hypothetical protein